MAAKELVESTSGCLVPRLPSSAFWAVALSKTLPGSHGVRSCTRMCMGCSMNLLVAELLVALPFCTHPTSCHGTCAAAWSI